ncbi:hypothetical protein [Chryseobacterium oranimense]|uniref:hypothetical protein n=1 Tax=Chryseobacterium oranimense TaxID=421058 RepID=UPI000595CA88|nr:hypothetical protein [Chryseobacterium oranimense]
MAFLDGFANPFFEELNFSVISGEYSNDISTARRLIDSIESEFRTHALFHVPNFPQMLSVYQEVFQSAFLHPIRQSLKHYRSLLDSVERHLTYKPGTSMIFHSIEDDKDLSRKILSAAVSVSELFLMNIDIAKIDHGISFTRESFKIILLLKHKLFKCTISGNVLYLLTKKCDFLLYKLSFRLQQKKEKFDYAIDFQYSSVQLIEVSEFKEFNDIIKGHYDNGINPTEFDTRFKLAKQKYISTPNTLSLDDYHALIKYYKDESQDLEELKKVEITYGRFYQTLTGSTNIFNKKAYDIAYCYIENNIMSLELDLKMFDLDNWKSKLKNYTDRADLSDNSNFFPYYKIIKKFLIPQITHLFTIKDSQSLVRINDLINDYEANLKKLIHNTGVCEEIDYIPFQTDFSKSLIAIVDGNGVNHNCFISSSFVLPLDYHKYFEELEEFKSELYKFKTMYDVQRLTQEDHKDIQIMKAEIDKTDKRHIEILSIFAALVMFVSNEIQIFSKVTNMKDAVSYTLFFAYGLGLFVLMIWFITRPEGLRRTSFSWVHKAIISIFAIGFISGLWYVNRKNPDPTPEEKKIIKLNYDIIVLKKQSTIDSLKNSKRANDKPK